MAVRFLGAYGSILRVRGARSFTSAGLLGRMSRSTSGIATILLVAASTDSFALGGVVAGAMVAGIAVGGPLWARSVDRFGQRRVLPWAIAALALSAAALGTAITLDAASWAWFVLAFALGASSIDTGSLVRARWAGVLRTPGERHTALALEAVGDELSFVIGPPLATILAATLAPIYGFAAGVGIATLGALWLLLQPATMPALHPPVARTRRAGWLPQGVGAALPLYPGVGLVFGSIDVSVVAVGSEAGNSALAGIILAIFSIGSVAAGLAFGQLSAAWSPTTRVWVAALGYAVLVPLLLLGTTPVLLAASVFVTGLATTPVLISGASLIESRVHRSRLTEAMAWPSVGLAVGVVLGSTLAGIRIDASDAYAGFWVSAIGAATVGVLGIACSALTRPRRDLPAVTPIR